MRMRGQTAPAAGRPGTVEGGKPGRRGSTVRW